MRAQASTSISAAASRELQLSAASAENAPGPTAMLAVTTANTRESHAAATDRLLRLLGAAGRRPAPPASASLQESRPDPSHIMSTLPIDAGRLPENDGDGKPST